MNYLSGLRAALLASSAIVAAYAAPAWAQQAHEFDLPAQSASSGIAAFAEQADVQILVMETDTRGRQTRAVQGNMTAAAGLQVLLEGSGLRVIADDGRTITLAAQDPQSGSAAGDGAEGTVDTLVVTAQKREEDIQDVPIAISAFTQEDLTRQQIAGGPDLITQVPNMTFTKTNFSSYSVQLRGIGTQAISATTDPAVAVAFNNTPFIRNRFFEQEFYDLQRVEVLRGPQGTLYGRNATAGVVNIISAKPKFIAEARASGDVANFNSTRVEGMVNVPIVEDKVALRVAAAWTKRDGYATNELTGNPIDGRDLWSSRVSLRVAPTDGIDINLIWEHFEEDDDRLRSGKQLCHTDEVTDVGGIPVDHTTIWVNRGNDSQRSGVQAQLSQGCKLGSLYSPDAFGMPNGSMLPYYLPLGAIGLPTALLDPYVGDVQTPDLRIIESTIDPTYRANNDLGELQVSIDLSDTLTLASETAYAADSVYSLQDFNRFNTAPGAWEQPEDYNNRENVLHPGPTGGIFCDPQLGCSDRLVAVDISTATSWQFSQELRLSSDFDGPLNFSLGANYLRADSEDKYYVFFNSIGLIAVGGASFAGRDPYVPGSDNSDCLQEGYAQGDPNAVYPVTGCTYLDPNPIESVNDRGHNYFLSKNPYKLISYAVFGEAYYQVTDALKITGGLRWTVDKKDAPRVPTWILSSYSVGYPVAEVIEQEWTEPTGRLAIDWKPDLSFTDETMIYGSLAHGYKAGGANPPGFTRVFYADFDIAQQTHEDSLTRPRTFEPEFIDAFELGTKNTLADGRVTLNLTGFYYDYEGYQVSEIVDRSAFNRNFDATVWGIEFESDWRPLDNLRLGVKVGYEKTRIADGEEAIDLMDRTAGDPNWLVVRPFPTSASSCILPTSMFARSDGVYKVGNVGGGGAGGCEIAYALNLDPVTEQPYEPVVITNQGFSVENPYLGFNPETAPNGGEGIAKPLGGNELPNAPDMTATITADYTVPLPGDWLVNLHTDLHWQSQSWWRVFNDHEFDVLDEYFTMNLAAIFTNEDAGWHVMAYIKNVTDETAITGAFLNSDDTGLTANVFLTEPRLYGLRVTKTWSGGPLLGSFGQQREGPYPFTLELGGQIQRYDAPNATQSPAAAAVFDGPMDIFGPAQANDLDWGDGRDVKLTWRPNSGPWRVSAQVRMGETNVKASPRFQTETPPTCPFGGAMEDICLKYDDPFYGPLVSFTQAYSVDTDVYEREEHELVDFMVGRDVGMGGLARSTVSAGLRYARLKSDLAGDLRGIPYWDMPPGFYYPGYTVSHTIYNIDVAARREFTGVGPQLSWEAAFPLFEREGIGRVDLDWTVSGGVLFGEQETSSETNMTTRLFEQTAFEVLLAEALSVQPKPDLTTVFPTVVYDRSEDATVPTLGASLGVAYSVGAFSTGLGYRWERYFEAIDGGYAEHQGYDRTIDGPYFKLSVGFGG